MFRVLLLGGGPSGSSCGFGLGGVAAAVAGAAGVPAGADGASGGDRGGRCLYPGGDDAVEVESGGGLLGV